MQVVELADWLGDGAFGSSAGELRSGLLFGTDVEHAVQAPASAARLDLMRAFPRARWTMRPAAARFEIPCESMVEPGRGESTTPWEEALATLVDRACNGEGWWRAAPPSPVKRPPRCTAGHRFSSRTTRLCDPRLPRPFAEFVVRAAPRRRPDSQALGSASAGARFECVGGVHPTVDDDRALRLRPLRGCALETVEERDALRASTVDFSSARERRGADRSAPR